MYFGNRQIRELLKAVYRDLYQYPIIESIRRANNHTLESQVIDPLFRKELERTRFLGVANPAESGCHLLYYFRQENGLPRNLFIHTHQVFVRNRSTTRTGARRRTTAPGQLQLRDAAVTRYIFIDDFCGSARQGTEYSRDLVEEIKRLDQTVCVEYYVLFATRQGIRKIRDETTFDTAKAIYELDASFRCFAAESRYFRSAFDGIDRGFCEQMCRRYGETMVDKAHALGFEDSQLLIGFQHNTPDNTLPIIWFDEPNRVPWKPIFRRYPKLEW